MIDLLRTRSSALLGYIEALVADVPDGKMAEQPLPGMNSPAWLLGHLAWASDLIPALLGEKPTHDEAWVDLFGPWSKASTDRSLYPPKDALLSALRDAHGRASGLLDRFTPEVMKAEMPDPRFRSLVPTIGDAVVHLLTTHEAVHTGQLSAWRRAMDLPPYKGLMFA